MGLPIVANADGGTGEQILHGVNGFLVSGEDPSEMSRQVELLLKNPEMAQAFGRAGQEIARRRFSVRLMVERYMKVLSPNDLSVNQEEPAVGNAHFFQEGIHV